MDENTLDDPRADIDGRTILSDEYRMLEADIDQAGGMCTLPVRITHNPITGITLEIGPYDLGGEDIQTLRKAIADVDHILATTPWKSAR